MKNIVFVVFAILVLLGTSLKMKHQVAAETEQSFGIGQVVDTAQMPAEVLTRLQVLLKDDPKLLAAVKSNNPTEEQQKQLFEIMINDDQIRTAMIAQISAEEPSIAFLNDLSSEQQISFIKSAMGAGEQGAGQQAMNQMMDQMIENDVSRASMIADMVASDPAMAGLQNASAETQKKFLRLSMKMVSTNEEEQSAAMEGLFSDPEILALFFSGQAQASHLMKKNAKHYRTTIKHGFAK